MNGYWVEIGDRVGRCTRCDATEWITNLVRDGECVKCGNGRQG